MKKVIRYRKVDPRVLELAEELFFRDNPEANTPELSELYEGGYIQRAREMLSAEKRRVREEFIRAKDQEADFYKSQAEYYYSLLQEISHNKEGYIKELEQEIEKLKEHRRHLENKIFQQIDEIRELKRQIRELEKYKPKPEPQEPQQKVIVNNPTQKKGRSMKWVIVKWTIIAAISIIFPLMPILLMPYLYFKLYPILYPSQKKQRKVTEYF